MGVTDVINSPHGEIVHGGAHAGLDGGGAGEQERDEKEQIDACPLRDASERGKGDVHALVGWVQIEAQGPVKVLLSAIAL